MVPPSLCTHPQPLCTHADTHTLRCPEVHDSHTHRQNAHSLPPTSHKCAAVMCPPASSSRHTNAHENGSDRFKYSLNLTLLRWVCHGVLNPGSCSHQAGSLPSYAPALRRPLVHIQSLYDRNIQLCKHFVFRHSRLTGIHIQSLQ